MNNRIIIAVLSAIIVIQMIAGIIILRRDRIQGPPPPPFGFMEDGPKMETGKHRMRGNRFGRFFCEPDFMQQKLEMSPEQIEKVSSLNRNFDAELDRYSRLIAPERKSLKKMLDNDKSDMNSIREQLKKIEEINIEIHLLRIRQGKEISEILSRDQMKMLHEERRMFFENMQKNRGGKR